MSVHTSIASAFAAIRAAIESDLEYAWGWHCNIAMPFIDAGGDADIANEAAARFMQTAFGVDTRKCDGWTYRRRSALTECPTCKSGVNVMKDAATGEMLHAASNGTWIPCPYPRSDEDDLKHGATIHIEEEP